MKCFLINLSIVIIYIVSGNAADYKVKIQSLEITSFNEEYVKDPIIKLSEFNETSQGVSCSTTVLKDLGSDIFAALEVTQELNGKSTPMYNIKHVDMCSLIAKNFIGLKDLLKYGNFTECPYVAGSYYANDVMIDFNQLPPSIPKGQYAVALKIFYKDVELGSGKGEVLIENQ